MINKIRFIEPGNIAPYKKTIANLFVYNKSIRNPSTGLIILTTITKELVDDTLMYSESIAKINFDDVYDADIIFIGINTFNALRGYGIAKMLKTKTDALIVIGGLHATLNYKEAVAYCDYVLLGEGDELIIQFINAINENKKLDFPGLAYNLDEKVVTTGNGCVPENIDIIPNLDLVYNYRKMAKLDTLWPQVHASRGCPHNCDYCSVVRLFGRRVRTRTPENVIEDIKQTIAFHKRSIMPRFSNVVWITDDNFHDDRDWAINVLNAIIESDIKYNFSVQARYEVGFDDELLTLMKKAGFIELAMGIEFIDDKSFEEFNKKSSRDEIIKSIENIKKHGLGVRGLFIVGSDNHYLGVGDQIADFAIKYGIHGVLIQSMFFIPGTPVYETYQDQLIHLNWDKYNGNVVHYPKNIKPSELQLEIIKASAKLYSYKRLFNALVNYQWINKVLFVGEFFWHRSIRKDLKKEIPCLKEAELKRY